MSIQDDLFDIQSALSEDSDKASFSRICDYLFSLEESNDEYDKLVSSYSLVIKNLQHRINHLEGD